MASKELAPSYVINFDPAIVHNGMECRAIELSEPQLKHLRSAYAEFRNGVNAETTTRYQIALVCAVTGKPQQVIEQMPIRKMNEASEYLQSFINAEPTNGSA